MSDDETPADEQPWCAMTLDAPGRPLQQVWRQQLPQPAAGQVRIRVAACGVCRTDLHIVDGELPWPGHALVPGHEIVGRVGALGPGVSGLSLRRSRPAPTDAPEPPVELLLEVDRAYRTGAQAGTLPTIAPKRFNPDGKAWLPVLHTERPGWHITALYSNTARAHELGRVHDWVVLYVEDDAHREHQYTVVTAGGGVLVGQRVVRGREAECRPVYAAQVAAPR
jgi:hypothetical protein